MHSGFEFKVYNKNQLWKLPKYHTSTNVSKFVMSATLLRVVVRQSGLSATRPKRLARFNGRGGVLAVAGGTLGDGLGLRARLSSLKLLADGFDGRSAGVGDGSSPAEVRVDTGKEFAVVRLGDC